MRQLEPPPPPELWAPGELWPGESTDLGGFLLAKLRQRNYTA